MNRLKEACRSHAMSHVPYVIVAVSLLAVAWPAPTAAQSAQDLRRLSLEELMQIEVTTVSRMPQSTVSAPAAVFVITQEDIRRSGATSIVEALRLAPGVHLGRIDANKWGIGIRGFPDRLARAMLVMIDGRAVYSRLFAGTYWEVQDVFLPDIERIEVIRGPGGTLWGANAVNGVINVITKRAAETQGVALVAGVGSADTHAAVRWGGARGPDLHYRAYAKAFDRGPFTPSSGEEFDDWRMAQTGFRIDWSRGPQRTFTLQGDAYVGEAGQRSQLTTHSPPAIATIAGYTELVGGNLLARWVGPTSELQMYYDRTNRLEPTFREFRDTFDIDAQRSFLRTRRHHVLGGVGYRVHTSNTESVATQRFLPSDRTDHLFTAFLQDEIALAPDSLLLTLGAKVEHNAYSGFEAQPNASLVWMPGPEQTVLLSVTRAVRTPSRVEHDFERTALLNPALPLFLRLMPNEDFRSEKLVAYEAAYRVRPANRLYLTASVFFNHLTDLLATQTSEIFVEQDPAPAHLIFPLVFANGLHGNAHGVEATADLRVTDAIRWTAAYSFLRIQLTPDAPGSDIGQERRVENLSPRHQVHTQMSFDLPRGWELDWMFRYVGEMPTFAPAYATSDIRLGYRVNSHLDLSLVGQDLHRARHLEFPGGGAGNVEVPRRVAAELTWHW